MARAWSRDLTHVTINILSISLVIFKINLKNIKNIFFITLLLKINKELKVYKEEEFILRK
jgi:hypothetical protein